MCVLLLSACSRAPRSGPAAPEPVPVTALPASPAPAAAVVTEIPSRPKPSDDDLARTVVSVFGDSAALHADSTSLVDDEPVWDLDVRSYETHERVAHYVRLFSTTAKDRFVSRLSRGTRYEPMIRSKLRASGMPEDLTFLALIESGYDPHAYSKAAAVGMWQFMSSTARDVGLRVDWWMDERRDPVRSTEGAIRFLGFLQRQFGSLYLAAAAYNGGPGRVARGLTRFAGEMEGAEGEDRFFALAEQDYLRAETKNYVPQLIAAALIAKMPDRYGLVVDSTSPLAYDSVRAPAGTSLAAIASASGADVSTMKDLNPAILRGVTPPDSAIWVHVPSGSATSAAAALDAMSADDRMGFESVRVAGSSTTPAAMAAKYGVTVKQLRWYNPSLKTSKKGRLLAGQTVRIPAREAMAFARELPDPSIERYGGSSGTSLARGGYHVVRRGETLGAIAKRYRVTVARLQSLNGLRGTRLIAGQTLRVSSTARTASSTASRSSTAKKTSSATKKTSSTAKKPSSTAQKTSSAAKKTSSTAKKTSPSLKKPSASAKKKSTAAKTSGSSARKTSAAKKPSSAKKPPAR